MVSPSDERAIEATHPAREHCASGLACVDAGTCTALTGYTPLFAICAPNPETDPIPERGIYKLRVEGQLKDLQPLLDRMDTPRALLEALVLQPMILDPEEWLPVIRESVKPSWFTSRMNLLAFRAVCLSRDLHEWRMRIKADFGANGLERMEDVYLYGAWSYLCAPDEASAFQALEDLVRGKRVEELTVGSLHRVRD